MVPPAAVPTCWHGADCPWLKQRRCIFGHVGCEPAKDEIEHLRADVEELKRQVAELLNAKFVPLGKELPIEAAAPAGASAAPEERAAGHLSPAGRSRGGKEDGWTVVKPSRKQRPRTRPSWTPWEWSEWRLQQKERDDKEKQGAEVWCKQEDAKLEYARRDSAARRLQCAARRFLGGRARSLDASPPGELEGADASLKQNRRNKKGSKAKKAKEDPDMELLEQAAKAVQQEIDEDLAAPDVQAVVASLQNKGLPCPSGHALRVRRSGRRAVCSIRASCSGCPVACGQPIASCDACDFNVCGGCVERYTGPGGGPAEPVELKGVG